MKPATSTAAPARDDEALRAGWEEIGQVDEYDRLHAPTSQEEREARECMKQALAAVGNPACRLTAEGVLESEWEGDED